MTTEIGFIGLGVMGKPMAMNLLKAGFPVTICGHTRAAPVAELCSNGAVAVSSPREVAERARVVVTCLPTTDAVEDVVFGVNGLIHGASTGTVLVDMSTISPTATRSIASRLAEAGIEMLDAPVSGGEPGAVSGTLAIMVGGTRSVYQECVPILRAMGTDIDYIGQHGDAQAIKLCSQVAMALTQIAAFEAFSLGVKAGLEPKLVHRVLSKTTARSWVIQEKMPRTVLAGNYDSGFKLRLMTKDLKMALDLGKEMGVPLFSIAQAYELYKLVESQGKGELENSVVSTLYQDAAGIDLATSGGSG